MKKNSCSNIRENIYIVYLPQNNLKRNTVLQKCKGKTYLQTEAIQSFIHTEA